MLIPCEGLYAVIEVKSVLTKEEIETAFSAARQLRQLKPYKGKFVSSRTKGEAACKGESRCMYIVFAYTSNLSAENWMQKEFQRAQEAAAAKGATLDMVDRIFVLDRGIINPGSGVGKPVDGDDDFLFVELYLNLVNFIQRELRRRPPIDWQIYSSRKARGWGKIC